jgi:hypothetical protein
MDFPPEVIEAQRERLSEKEWKFCKKLYDHISKMPHQTESQREDVMNYVRSHNKLNAEIKPYDNGDIILYSYDIGHKRCWVVFDRFGNEAPNFVPSGVVMTGTN